MYAGYSIPKMATKILEKTLAARQITDKAKNIIMIYPGLILNLFAILFKGCTSLNGSSTFETIAIQLYLTLSVIVMTLKIILNFYRLKL